MTGSLHDGLGEETFRLLSQLIACETESRSPNLNLVDFVADRCAAVGGSSDILHGPTGRANLAVRLGPDAAGGVLLSGHTDVVAAGSGWETDPYSLTPVGTQLRGRGTADMKGFIAVALAVVTARDWRRARVPVRLGLSYDEEIGCVGVRSLLRHLESHDTCQPELVVVGEPTELQVVTEHAGKVAFSVNIRCPAAHSLQSPTRPNAISIAADLVRLIDRINNAQPASKGLYSANVGSIGGGVAVNVLAPTCDLDIEFRYRAGIEHSRILEELDGAVQQWDLALHDGGGVETNPIAAYPPLATDAGAPTVRRVVSLGPVGTGFCSISFGCEAGLYAESLSAPTIVYGPGSITDAHRPNEFVEIEQLIGCQRFLERILTEFTPQGT